MAPAIMTDFSNHKDTSNPGAGRPPAANVPTANVPAANVAVFSVSEISQAIKRALEGNFEWVRVRGEISGFKRAASGHLYMSLKDEGAVLDAVCWRGGAARLGLMPEDGMEVIASGRVTSYPGRSKYQIVIERLELAGEGALLKLLEERKRKLAAEGLFAEARKRPPPYLPEVLGVVTSPTGAVIRDILHRLADRFPRRVLVWPVLVQGEGAAAQIAAAIRGFNALPAAGPVPRPDVLIVARGGGSLEDLWAFNEEAVVRAAAESKIPLISAVGHETDVTLIDFAADRRAPTPSAAAEMAVPVRAELRAAIADSDRRLRAAARRALEQRRVWVEGLARGLPEPRRLVEDKAQRLDDRVERLHNALAGGLRQRAERVRDLGARLPHPRRQIGLARERLEGPAGRFAALVARPRAVRDKAQALAALERVLRGVSYQRTLARGFAVVRDPGGVISSARGVSAGLALDIEFADGHAAAVGTSGGGAARAPARRKRGPAGGEPPQGTLL